MRIVVSCTGLDVAAQFGAADCLTCYNVDKGVIVGCQTLPFPRVAPEDLIAFLQEMAVTAVVCGAIDPVFAQKLNTLDIDVAPGFAGKASDAARSYLAQAFSGAASSDDECDEDPWD